MPDLHSVRSLRTLFSVDNNVLLLRAEELMTVSRLGRRPTMEALLGCLTAAAVVLCTPLSSSLRAQPATPLALASPFLAQPPNVGDAKAAATAYHDSGAYARDLALVASDAGAWIGGRASQVSRSALVLDIDDTALTNWMVIKADDFGRVINGRCTALPEGPCGWAAWDFPGKAPVIAPTLSLFGRRVPWTSQCFSSRAAQSHSALPPNRICAMRATTATPLSKWCQRERAMP